MLTLPELEKKILASSPCCVTVEHTGVWYSLGKRYWLPVEYSHVMWIITSSFHLACTGGAIEEVIAIAKKRGGPTVQEWLDPSRHIEEQKR